MVIGMYGQAEAYVAAYSANAVQVLPNAFMGIVGGYNVSVLWVLNGRSAQWESQLPAATQRWLDRQRRAVAGPYKNYPYVQNNLEAPGPLISLLSQQASWSFRMKKDQVVQWVLDAKGSRSGPKISGSGGDDVAKTEL